MSEPTGTGISIGGKLHKDLIPEFLDAVRESFSEISNGPTTIEDLLAENGQRLHYDGVSNYGMLDDLTAFCKKYGLTYSQFCCSGCDWDPGMSFWSPEKGDIGTQASQDSEAVVSCSKVRPIIKFLLDLLKNGHAVVPTYFNDPVISPIALRAAKNEDLHTLIQEYVDQVMPTIPDVPPLEIIYE